MNRYLFLLAIIALCSCSQPSATNHAEGGFPEYKTAVRSFPVPGNGWGYIINVNGKDFIRQETVPVLQGYHVFRTEKDAEAVGNWVATRIRRNEKFTLTLPVLKSLMHTDDL